MPNEEPRPGGFASYFQTSGDSNQSAQLRQIPKPIVSRPKHVSEYIARSELGKARDHSRNQEGGNRYVKGYKVTYDPDLDLQRKGKERKPIIIRNSTGRVPASVLDSY